MGAAVAAQAVDDLAIELGDGNGLLEGEIQGMLDAVVFRGMGEGRVLQGEGTEDGLEVGAGGANDAGERTLRGSKYLLVQGTLLWLALLGGSVFESGPAVRSLLGEMRKRWPEVAERVGEDRTSQVVDPPAVYRYAGVGGLDA